MELPEFRRDFFDPARRFTRIGSGEIGGKAASLISIFDVLQAHIPDYPPFEVTIPTFTVLCTDIFDQFVERNHLREIGNSGATDDVIAHEFQKADFPVEILGDIRGLVEKVRVPLAVRSSSLLEDSLRQPFAGIYTTKMIPNNAASADERFRKFVEAIKLVYASAFFSPARDYLHAVGMDSTQEKMAVVIQEVAGTRFRDLFYPEISGVARSYNYYPISRAKPEDGLVSLALGLGKTIVDGEKCWTYTPAYPKLAPPTGSIRELMAQTQTKFWSVNMGKPPAYDPIQETEYLTHADTSVAELDGTLRLLASTYDPAADRLTPGTGREGARVLNFAGILQNRDLPLNDLIRKTMNVCQEAQQMPVEIEFAVTLGSKKFSFLQVRPMMMNTETYDIREEDWNSNNVWLATTHALGNGRIESICDIVYVDPENFDLKNSREIAKEVGEINAGYLGEHRPYVLIGFGRWGSADAWLGIPVNWGQVSGAKVIVETTLPNLHIDLSQGSHFFHNLISFKVAYFSVRPESGDRFSWDWLLQQTVQIRKKFVRTVRLDRPFQVAVDGRTGKGLIYKSVP